MRVRHHKVVHSVTEAPRSRTADLHSREVRYLISMGIRTACFVLAFLASGPLRWGLLVGAVILPYVAVVLANAGRERKKVEMSKFTPAPPRTLASNDSRGPLDG